VRRTVGNVEMLRGRLGIGPGGSVSAMMAAQGLDPGAFGDAGGRGSGMEVGGPMGATGGMGNGVGGALDRASDFGRVNGVDVHAGTNGFGVSGEEDEGEEWEDEEDDAEGEGEWEGSASG
jgi:hypothetical protein